MGLGVTDSTDALLRASVSRKGPTVRIAYDDDCVYVQSRRKLDPVTPDHQTWLLCHLVDDSAREPMKDVPSCDKPGGAARRLRTRDLRMGIPIAIASRNREHRELKHLSTGRKRNQHGMSLVTASEHDLA